MAEHSEYAVGVAILCALIAVLLVLRSWLGFAYIIDPTPTPVPSPLPTPSPSFEEILSSELKKLTEGHIAFNPPSTMKQGQAERMEARITSQDIGARLTEGLKGRGVPKIENVKVGNSMKVFLNAKDDEFRITKLSSDEQWIVSPYSQWEWEVTPLSFGEQSLHLTATVTLNLDRFGEKSIDVPVIDRRINVSISPTYILTTAAKQASWWQILFGSGSLIGGAVAVREIIKRRKKKAGFV